MNTERITHKSEARIRIDFPYNQEIASRIRQINDARWSKELRAWHIPDTAEAIEHLKSLFADKAKEKTTTKTDANTTPLPKTVTIHITEKRISIKLPKSQDDIQYICSFRYSRWDPKDFVWLVPNYKDSAVKIKEYFADRIFKITEDISDPDAVRDFRSKNELVVIKTNSGSMRIISTYSRALTRMIKQFPYAQWQGTNKWWTIPYADKFKDELEDFAEANDLKFVYKEEEGKEVKAKLSKYDVPNYRPCPEEFTQKLIELRYSEQTLKTYSSMFEEFINYYHEYDIDRIDEKMIKAFLRYLIVERKISSSYQNQSINAIKFYYERVLGGQRKMYYIDRPAREKTLPTVLSEQEVVDIISTVTNIKHKAILMTIYSAGLRIGELTRLKISDVDSKRMQIYVQQSKGKKDRYTILSTKALEILRLYFLDYKPKEYLFEGQNGGEYSRRSIQAVLKTAVSKTDITKKVTVHTLRHSFATHLLENGTDIRYIQSLLGHESSITTEVYTHITTKGFDQIQSPLDKLNI